MREKVYYYKNKSWYKGSSPVLYNTNEQPATKILKENYETIKSEIVEYYTKNEQGIPANFTPYNYSEEGWKTVNLFGYLMEHRDNFVHFPKTIEILKKIPNLSGSQISILAPNTRIKAHMGDTDAIIRNHIGIVIPGGYPEIGFQIKNETVCWKEGETISFCITHRHYAWNYTDKYRIIFQVDVLKPEYWSNRYIIAGKALSAITMKLIATRKPILKKIPNWLGSIIHFSFGIGFSALIIIQDKFNFHVSSIFSSGKKKK